MVRHAAVLCFTLATMGACRADSQQDASESQWFFSKKKKQNDTFIFAIPENTETFTNTDSIKNRTPTTTFETIRVFAVANNSFNSAEAKKCLNIVGQSFAASLQEVPQGFYSHTPGACYIRVTKVGQYAPSEFFWVEAGKLVATWKEYRVMD